MSAEFGGWGNRMIRKVGDLCGLLEMGTEEGAPQQVVSYRLRADTGVLDLEDRTER